MIPDPQKSEFGALTKELEKLLNEPVSAAEQRASTELDRAIDPAGRKIVLLGAGYEGRRALKRLREDGIDPLAFADNDPRKWGTTCEGLPILSPTDAARRHGREAVFIVAIYSHDHSFIDSRQKLVALGCANVISLVPLRWKYHETFLPSFHDDLPHKVLPQAEQILRALRLWSDYESQREFVAQIRWRLLGDFDALSPVSRSKQYFPETEIYKLRNDEWLVDAGAYSGDTIEQLVQLTHGNFQHVLALEPDPTNFARLQEFIARLPAHLGEKVAARPLALGEVWDRIRFDSGGGMGSRMQEHGSVEVERIPLDKLLPTESPTIFKMDIEGAELEAINGAKKVLGRAKPVVTVAVYHTQDHLWKIPLALREIHPSYNFFLRPHELECWDTICYAVPTDRVLK